MNIIQLAKAEIDINKQRIREDTIAQWEETEAEKTPLSQGH